MKKTKYLLLITFISIIFFSNYHQAKSEQIKTSITTTLIEPTNHNFTTDPIGIFRWTTVSGAYAYHFQVGKDAEFNELVINDTLSTNSYRLKSNLEPTTLYYWRVLPLDAGYTFSWSMVYDFKYNPAINFESLTGTFCPGYYIKLSYSIDIWFQEDNLFNLEISDENGEFSKSSRVIGYKNAIFADSIVGFISLDLPPSNKYKLRVRTTNPVFTYILPTEDFSFINLPKGQVINYYGNACPGKTTYLNALDFPGIKTKWRVNNCTIIGSDTSAKVAIKWPTTGTANVSVVQYTNRGCKDSNSYIYYVNPDPVSVTMTGKKNVCLGQPFTYKAVASGPASFEWKVTNGTIIGPVNQDTLRVVWNKTAGSVSVKTINASGCTDSTTTTVSGIPDNALSLTVPKNTCLYEEYVVKISNPNKLNYNWKITGGIIIGNGTGDSLRVLINEPKCIITLTGFLNADDCVVTASDTMNSSAKPYPSVFGEETVCSEKVYTYKTSHIEKSINFWSVVNGDIVSPNGQDSVRVKWQKTGPCQVRLNRRFVDACDTTLTFNLVAYEKMETPKITRVGDSLVSNSKRRHNWYRNGEEIEKAHSNVYKPIENGDYTCQVMEDNLCSSDTSNHILITDNGVIDLPAGFNIYPNPTNSKFTLEFNSEYELINVKIVNSLGQIISTENVLSNNGFIKKEFDLEKMPAGIYYLNILVGKDLIRKSIVKW